MSGGTHLTCAARSVPGAPAQVTRTPRSTLRFRLRQVAGGGPAFVNPWSRPDRIPRRASWSDVCSIFAHDGLGGSPGPPARDVAGWRRARGFLAARVVVCSAEGGQSGLRSAADKLGVRRGRGRAGVALTSGPTPVQTRCWRTGSRRGSPEYERGVDVRPYRPLGCTQPTQSAQRGGRALRT